LKDVLFVNSGDPWNPRPETVAQVKAMLEGVHRVLKLDGIFISISFGQVGLTNTEFLFSFWVGDSLVGVVCTIILT
jgi:ubiquinone/menaquinone biosynthesis C-methylase UbiE